MQDFCFKKRNNLHTLKDVFPFPAPLPTPENPTPEEPSTPRSGKASTLYVTVPSELSDDRTITPMTTAKHPHLAILRQESPFARSVTSSHPSDEFVSLSSVVIIIMIISSLCLQAGLEF